MRRHVIEVLFRDRCPFVLLAIDRVRAVVGGLALDVEVELRLVKVDTLDEAVSRDLRGSPSVRVDGVDVDPRAAMRPVGTHPRGYVGDSGLVERVPPESWIGAALSRTAMTI